MIMPAPKNNHSIIIGLSGGVDSAVAAYLLQKQGYTVRAVFMKNFSGRVGELLQCPWKEDRRSAYEVAAYLNIPIETWDLEKDYRKQVLDYLYREYRAGRTPNPDIRCNSEIKFKLFLHLARRAGADAIATGHYARVKRSRDGAFHLLKGLDSTKDQSYFLAGLNQQQLSQALFPLGAMKKSQVRILAKKIGLPNYDRPDSQGICFVGEVKMLDFLQAKIKPKPGKIIDTSGKVVGKHPGVYYFTIGQRRGLDLGGGPIRYVVAKDVKKNILTVGEVNDAQLYTREVRATDWHWVSPAQKFPLTAKAKLRYRQADQSCIVTKKTSTNVAIKFKTKQRAVTPGQIVAFYQGSELIASATII